MTVTPLEALLIAGFGATSAAIIAAYITSRVKERKFITKEACMLCGTRQWAENLRQLCTDTYYLKQVVRLLAEHAKIPQDKLLDLENQARDRMI